MKDWQKGLHKLEVLVRMGLTIEEITQEFYLQYNDCRECKYGPEAYRCKFVNDDWLPKNGWTSYCFCPHWEPK